ncbi:winged helix-turn-helix domain-containing protein [Isosphaeraceae bacterium EP7]
MLFSERQVYAWVARYNADGPDALDDRPGRGRKGPLTDDEPQRLKARLLAGPTEADGVCTLRGEDFRRILHDEFGVVRSLQDVYDLLHRLGFEPLRPRPQHPGGDAEAQAAFKKVSSSGSLPSPSHIPAGESRSGSRPRPASARREC